MARIVVAGSGSVGACIAYHLALLGARDVVLAERAQIASGSTGKAMGGVGSIFVRAEVRLAGSSVFESRRLVFQQSVTSFSLRQKRSAELGERCELQTELGVPASIDPRFVPGCLQHVLGAVSAHRRRRRSSSLTARSRPGSALG